MKAPREMMGFETPDDKRVTIAIRDWNAVKLALWRSQVGWAIAERQALELVDRAAHMEGCPAKEVETEPCLADCPDRELRMSALVILNAARQFAPVDAKKIANAPYFAPTREYYSAILADLTAAQAELEALRPDKPVLPPPQQLKEGP